MRRLKVTSVVVTHDMRSARRVGQRILMLHEGRIHADGTPEEIFNSTDPVVQQFVNGIADSEEHPFEMNKSGLEWKVGLFVVLSLVFAAAFIMKFSKSTSVFTKTYEMLLVTSNVGGIREGASVLMAGVQVGTVRNINLDESGKIVTMHAANSVPLSHSCRRAIYDRASGLFGRPVHRRHVRAQ